MSIFRVNKNQNYTIMSNHHFKEKKMSLKAKGLLSLMLSLPDNWDYSIAGLVTLSADGESSVRTALQELEKFGYLKRTRTRKAGKLDDIIYDIYETPHSDFLNVENLKQENLILENQAQLNTNNINNLNNKNTKKKNNTKKDFSDMILKICLENDIEDDKSIELIEQFLMEMKIKTKGSIEANIAKVAGKTFETINKCIQKSYERNYKYITPPEWLQPPEWFQDKNTSYNGNGKCSKELAWRTHEEMEEAEKKRHEFFEKVKNNDPSIHHF